MRLTQLDHLAISVRDVERSVHWYGEVLGLRREHGPATVGVGETWLAFTEAPPGGEPEEPAAPGLRHFAFRAGREAFEEARRELSSRGIEFSFEDHRVAHSIYFRDPDGHRLEVTTYEVGDGD